MNTDVQEFVDRFLASLPSRKDEPSSGDLAQLAEDAWQHAASASLEQACLEWWSVLPVTVQQKWLANPQTSTMREAWCERRKRQEAVEFARANVGLEGFRPSRECEALSLRFINGEIELFDFFQPPRM